jgi:hypothetical protein
LNLNHHHHLYLGCFKLISDLPDLKPMSPQSGDLSLLFDIVCLCNICHL